MPPSKPYTFSDPTNPDDSPKRNPIKHLKSWNTSRVRLLLCKEFLQARFSILVCLLRSYATSAAVPLASSQRRKQKTGSTITLCSREHWRVGQVTRNRANALEAPPGQARPLAAGQRG
jgi:hypothetical protein